MRMNINKGVLIGAHEKVKTVRANNMAEPAENGLVIILDPYLWMMSYGMVIAFTAFFVAIIARRYYREQEK